MTRHPHSALFYRSPFSAIPASLVGLCLVAAGCGSGGGTAADQPLVIPEVSEVAAGDPTCPAGGVRVQLGADDNRDGDLDDDEVDSTSYVCNGTDMVGGEDNVLVRTVELPLNDAACPAGGRRLDVGLDNGDGTGLPDNDILEDDEVDTSFLDCNGTMTVVVAPPSGPTGTAVLDTHGGANRSGGGAQAGDIREDSSREFVDSHLMIANTGAVDASCTPPTLTISLGSVPADITSNTTLALVAPMDETNLADGEVFMRLNDSGMYRWDDTNGVAQRVTGLRVAAGVTLSLPHNAVYTTNGVGLGFENDVDVAGTVTTVAASGAKGALEIYARQVRFAATSSIDLRGSETDQSGYLVLDADQDLLALGSIDTSGHSAESGGSGGDVDFEAGGAIYTGGTIVTQGGDATSGNGGGGGSVEYEARTRLICNSADITTDGGDANGIAGTGGYINFGDDCVYTSTVELRNSGDLRTRGGNEAGSCDEVCRAGDGGPITFIAVQSGSVSSSGSIDTRGGSSENAAGGDGGNVEVRPGAYFESVEAVSVYSFSGTITTFGGDGETEGGNGGNITAFNQGSLGSGTRFLGYASALLDGGDGSSGGGSGGDIDFSPDMDGTNGGMGLFVYTNVSSVGGAGGTGSGGPGGSIYFDPDTNYVVRGSASEESFVVTGTIDLRGGDGGSGGHGGDIAASDGCGPNIVTTGIRVGGTITLNGGDGATGSGERSGGLYLATARGGVDVSGTIQAVGGEGESGVGGYFPGSSFFGAPVRFAAAFTASGGVGSTQGGNAEDVAILSVGAASSVTGAVTLTAGTGPTAASNGTVGAVRVDTGNACVSPP